MLHGLFEEILGADVKAEQRQHRALDFLSGPATGKEGGTVVRFDVESL